MVITSQTSWSIYGYDSNGRHSILFSHDTIYINKYMYWERHIIWWLKSRRQTKVTWPVK